MMNFSKETILETVTKYMELLFNLLDPFMGNILQTKGIGQNEQKMEEVGHKVRKGKRQRKEGD